MAKREISPADLRSAAERRASPARAVNDVSALFATHRTRSTTPADHRLPVVRCTEELARRIAKYGNTHGLTISQAMRDLLEIGLNHQDEEVP